MKKTNSMTVDQLKSQLWKACDTFRNTIDSNQYKDYILSFLFLKYISDVYENKLKEYTKKYKGDKIRIKRRLEREVFILKKECTFQHIFENRNENNIGEIINEVFHEVEELNKKKLNGVFGKVDFNSESILGKPKSKNALLRHLINDFKDLDLKQFLGQSDIIGSSYLYLINNFAAEAGKKGGEFFTPEEVSILLAKIIEPKQGDKIYDPTCGSGSLLIKARQEIKNTNFSLYGQEVNGGTWALAKMNMFLHGIRQSYIRRGDTIRSPQFIDEKGSVMQFHKVITNPPFSKKKWGYENVQNDRRFHRGLPPPSKGDWAFISHMVESLLAKGKAGVVVPHGVLFRGASEGRIRTALIKENKIHAVIGLASNLFFGTSIPTALLIFDTNKTTKDILFIDASRDFEEGKNQNKLREQDITKIYKAYKKRKTIEKYAYLASLKEVEEQEYNLNITRYVDTFEEEEEIDIKAVQKEIEILEEELTQVRKKMKHHLSSLRTEKTVNPQNKGVNKV
ncbi:MAG: type I restriction-modification system subunit M [Bdellovibrionales bacterium]|nr:type I restriction-modification system subunit M [Bdellovibrionales bacterium]